MIKQARYYLARLAKARHIKSIENEMPRKMGISGKVVREWLLAGGYIEITGAIKQQSGKSFLTAKATGKELPVEDLPKPTHGAYWEDGTPRSQSNWFNWREMSKGLFSRTELANDRTTAYRGQQ